MLPRIRTVKPEFFRHWDLFKAEQETGLPLRLAYIGLWTCCDREGRFPWRPQEVKVVVLPHDDVDFSRVLDALTTRGFLAKYTTAEGVFGWVPSFTKHQIINNKERASAIPPPPASPSLPEALTRARPEEDATATREPRVPNACNTGTGTGTDGERSPSPSLAKDQQEFRVGDLRALWNEHAKRNNWPCWNEGARKRERLARIILGSRPSRTRWQAALERASQSSFLLGRTSRDSTHANWRPTADWLLKSDTLGKIEEGQYDDRGGSPTGTGDLPRDPAGGFQA